MHCKNNYVFKMIVFKDFFMNKLKNSLVFFLVFVFKVYNSENILTVWPSSPELERKANRTSKKNLSSLVGAGLLETEKKPFSFWIPL